MPPFSSRFSPAYRYLFFSRRPRRSNPQIGRKDRMKYERRGRTESSLLALIAACAFSGAVYSQPLASVSQSLTRYSFTDTVPTATQANIFAARNEYESFQIFVRSVSGLSNVNLSASNLTGPNGAVIPAASITLFREHYVYTTQIVRPADLAWHTNLPLGAGWYPDALIPFKDPATGVPLAGSIRAVPVNVLAGQNQAFWVDILVPAGIPAGNYTGNVTVTSDQGQASVSVNLRVWNFDLPKKPSLKSNFNYWAGSTDQTAITSVTTRRVNEELLRNRVMPATVNLPDERSFIDNFGLVNTALVPWSGANAQNCTMSAPPTVSSILAEKAQHQPDVFLSMNIADEVGACTNLYPQIQAWARNLHAAGVPNMVVMPPTPALFDDGSGTGRSAVDIWDLLPMQYDANTSYVQQALAKGDSVWSYNTLMEDQYSPKWQIDYPPINFRIQPGFINQSLGLSGLTYWRVDMWTADPWHDVEGVIFTAAQTGTSADYKYRGEGMMLYPGAQIGLVGAAPSMRLKYIRDGVDDYEYINILKKLGWASWALGVARTVGPDWRNWTRDVNALESARYQLGSQIEQLMGAQVAAAPPVVQTAPPATLSVSVTSPASGATVSGITPIATVTSSDITRVEFSVDNVYKGTSLTSPFTYNLDTTVLPNGSHTITAVAYNSSWNMKIVSVPVTVSNGAPATGGVTLTINSPVPGANISGVTPITTTPSSNVVRVEFYVDNVFKGTVLTSPFSYSLDTRSIANGIHAVTVVAYDAAWNMKIGSVSVTVSN
jgi:Domain of unknown function (DUF4091)/Bacterial Ig domain